MVKQKGKGIPVISRQPLPKPATYNPIRLQIDYMTSLNSIYNRATRVISLI